MTRTLSHPPALSFDDIQHFVMEDASWDLYEKLLRDIGDRPIRVTYDDGRMEIMSPLPEHEQPKTLIGRMIEMLAFEMNKPMASLGSTTFRRKEKAKGLEPDECYYFKDEAKMRGRKRLDLKKDPPPELVVEIDVTSRSVPRADLRGAWRAGNLAVRWGPPAVPSPERRKVCRAEDESCVPVSGAGTASAIHRTAWASG